MMQANIEMSIIECVACGMPFAMPTGRKQELRNCHNTFYCPNGHGQSYQQETEAEKLRRIVRQKEKQTESWRNLYHEERGSRIAYQGLATKRKKELEKQT